MKTKIIVITHPDTSWTTVGRYQGHVDVPLNEVGLAKVAKVVERFSDEAISCVYSSDLSRSFETAAAIAKDHNIKHIADLHLREGRWEKQQGSYEYPLLPFYTELETQADVIKRGCKTIEEIAEKNSGETTLIISHWGITNLFITNVLKNDSNFHDQYLGILAAVNIFEFDSGIWRCLSLNESGFLDGFTSTNIPFSST